MSPFASLYVMSNESLVEEAERLASNERASTAHLVAAISEIDARSLYLAEGCTSISMYCMRVLRLSQHAAYDRITAGRVARRFPVVLQRLADGSLTLANLTLIAPYLTPDNCEQLLAEVEGKSKREVDVIIAELRPLLAAPQVYRLQLSVSRETWDKLRKVQELLSHSIPDGDPSRIFERAIALLLEQTEKRKLGKTDRPRQAPAPPTPGFRTRYVSPAVRREVAERDGHCCAFVGPAGRCAETRRLEFHHKVPHAAGGLSDASNIELRCQAHNQYESEVFFGPKASAWRTKRDGGTRPGASAKVAGESEAQPKPKGSGEPPDSNNDSSPPAS